jgi:hypothetical protein
MVGGFHGVERHAGDDMPFWLTTALFKAMLAAETAGAKEIGVEHLLAELESSSGEPAPVETPPEIPEIRLPVPHRDMMLSEKLSCLLESLGDLQQMNVTDLQRALRSS